jgi:hypothetical protein
VNMLLPLLVAVTIAQAFTVLVLKRSILTEKVASRLSPDTGCPYLRVRARSSSSMR